MKENILLDFQPELITRDEPEPRRYTTAGLLRSIDLFSDMNSVVDEIMKTKKFQSATDDGAEFSVAAFVLSDFIAVTVEAKLVRPSLIQCLLYKINEIIQPLGGETSDHLKSEVIDASCGLTLWTKHSVEICPVIKRFWTELVNLGKVDQLEAMTIPRLYGNKLRLTSLVTGVAAATLPQGSSILDLMSGTGILTRKFSDRHPVWCNDGNPYAALLSKCQTYDTTTLDVKETVRRLQGPFGDNYKRLSTLVDTALKTEGEFLHGDLSIDVIQSYKAYTTQPILAVGRGMRQDGIYSLFLERYANVYFGVGQTIEIDSLRAAIDTVYPAPSQDRDICLAALILAVTTCNTGPHFAQPSPLPSVNADCDPLEKKRALRLLGTIIERRARSVSWEFDLALTRLAARRPPVHPPIGSSIGDWRVALDGFIQEQGDKIAGIYVDPPYSKLQYSRYYHVLNVLLSYDYLPVEGVGRYPPLTNRFSSRFESSPESARKEFEELFQRVSQAGMTLLISYGQGGFVQISKLTTMLAKYFSRVDMFSEEIRHHAQGMALDKAKKRVMEHVIVGRP